MKATYFTKKEIAELVGLTPKTFQRWTNTIGLKLGRGLIPEESLPEIREEIRKYALEKVKKSPPDLFP
jgi:hypothetical protein